MENDTLWLQVGARRLLLPRRHDVRPADAGLQKAGGRKWGPQRAGAGARKQVESDTLWLQGRARAQMREQGHNEARDGGDSTAVPAVGLVTCGGRHGTASGRGVPRLRSHLLPSSPPLHTPLSSAPSTDPHLDHVHVCRNQLWRLGSVWLFAEEHAVAILLLARLNSLAPPASRWCGRGDV
eukprot:364466-Chlamydomonas_euryale.AAC.10